MFPDYGVNNIPIDDVLFDVSLVDKTKKTVLMHACTHGNIDVVEKLVAERAFQLKKRHPPWRAMITLDAKDEDGLSALSHAVNNHHHEIAFLLLDQKDIDISSSDKSQIFLWAYEMDKPGIFNKLFDEDSFDHNIKTAEGDGIIHLSYLKNDTATFDRILHSNNNRSLNNQLGLFDVNQVDKTEQTVLMHACTQGDVDAVEKLVATKTINVNKKGPNGKTALMMACLNDYHEIVNLFIKKRNELSINLQLKDESGKTAFEMAKDVGSEKVIELNKICRGVLQVR